MRRMNSIYAALVVALASLVGVVAYAQLQPPFAVPPNINQSVDIIPVTPNAQPTPSQPYAPAGQITAVESYVNGGAVLTGATFTYPNGTVLWTVQPAGTLAALTVITEPNPGDGKRECFLSTQTTTSLTVTANTGQTVNNAPTAGVAMTPICWIFSKTSATWYRSN